jgi:hypothetical protein
MGLLAWTAMDQFDLSAQQMREAFLAAGLLIGLIAGLGAIAAAIWIGIRALLARRKPRS